MIKKAYRKFFSSAEAAIFGKDFGELWKFGGYRSILVGILVILAFALPLMYLVAIMALSETQVSAFTNISRLIPAECANYTYRQCLFYILMSMICPLFYVLIPILTSVITASIFFVGEKENETMATLLTTACAPSLIFRSKFFCAIVNSIVLSFASFISISIIASVGSVYFEIPFFLNASWAVEVFLLSPALAVMGVFFVYFYSHKQRHVLDVIMTCGFLVLPFILMFIGQFAGLYEISWIVLLTIAIAVLIFDIACYHQVNNKITAEKLL